MFAPGHIRCCCWEHAAGIDVGTRAPLPACPCAMCTRFANCKAAEARGNLTELVSQPQRHKGHSGAGRCLRTFAAPPLYFGGPLRALPLFDEQTKPFAVVLLRAKLCISWVTRVIQGFSLWKSLKPHPDTGLMVMRGLLSAVARGLGSKLILSLYTQISQNQFWICWWTRL